jgi:hypothetical protein
MRRKYARHLGEQGKELLKRDEAEVEARSIEKRASGTAQ